MLYMVTFIINIPQMLAYIPYMDPMGYILVDFPSSGLRQTQRGLCISSRSHNQGSNRGALFSDKNGGHGQVN